MLTRIKVRPIRTSRRQISSVHSLPVLVETCQVDIAYTSTDILAAWKVYKNVKTLYWQLKFAVRLQWNLRVAAVVWTERMRRDNVRMGRI